MAATLPPGQAPAPQEYGGDEINALILDPGSFSTRAGFAGEDTPKSVIPTSYVVTASGDKLYGENAIHLPRAGAEIVNPYNADGIVEDWETAARLWEYSITSRLTGPRRTAPSKNGLNQPSESEKKDDDGDVNMEAEMEENEEQERVLSENPLLMTEPGWNPAKAREKTIELAMEDWHVPAFFLAKTGQLAAYSQGKPTALVVDVGHKNTSITALYDGMVLKKALVHTPLAGSWLNSQLRLMFSSVTPAVPLVPHYMVATKTPVDAGVPSNATYKKFDTPPSASFRAFEEERVLASFKESVVQAWPGPGTLSSPSAPGGGATNADSVKNLPPRAFELPDGWNQVFGLERFKVVEGLFSADAAYTSADSPAPSADQSITACIRRAVDAVDVDARPHLLNNIIVTGAGSLIDKLPERIQSDLAQHYPNPKVRVIANSSSAERKFGAWIGGSVLGSLGTFHQMWVSRQEYDEFGAGVVEKRCK